MFFEVPSLWSLLRAMWMGTDAVYGQSSQGKRRIPFLCLRDPMVPTLEGCFEVEVGVLGRSCSLLKGRGYNRGAPCPPSFSSNWGFSGGLAGFGVIPTLPLALIRTVLVT